jgi:hypothetical protein
MAKIGCKVEFTTKLNEYGRPADITKATCLRCGHTTWSYGGTERSVRRCCLLLCKGCPRRERNFYVERYST